MQREKRDAIAIVGAGTMGCGLAALALSRGLDARLIDSDERVLNGADKSVQGHLRTAQMIGVAPSLRKRGALSLATSIDAVRGASYVCEAIVEDPVRKRVLLSELSQYAASDALIALCTSAIPIGELAEAFVRPGNVVGVHFMNPPYIVRTAEVVCSTRTTAEVLDRTRKLLKRLGQDHVVVADRPGFVINRILQRTLNDAARMLDDNVAAAEDIDALFVKCLGHRLGPLATADLIGVDNVIDTLLVIFERTGDRTFVPCGRLMAMRAAGTLGRKTGRGFYDYRDPRHHTERPKAKND